MKILIVNLHSALNLGDDAIMHATLLGIKRAYPEAQITLSANDPHSWEKHSVDHVLGSFTTWFTDRREGGWTVQKGLSIFYLLTLGCAVLTQQMSKKRVSFGNEAQRALLEAYYDADLILSCGGGNFYSEKLPGLGFIWSLVMLGFGVFFGKKAIMLPQTIGPIPFSIHQLMARTVFNRVRRILVRDQGSEELLRRIGVTREIILVPDLAFSLSTEEDHNNIEANRNRAFEIGVTVINRGAQYHGFRSQETYEKALVNVLKEMAENNNIHIRIFAQCFGPTKDQDDRVVSEQIFEKLRECTDKVTLCTQYRDALELKKAYQKLDGMIGSRMHTSILSLISGIPTVLIGYQPKAVGVMSFYQLERFLIPINEVTEERLSSIVADLIKNQNLLRKEITEHTKVIQRKLDRWENYLLL